MEHGGNMMQALWKSDGNNTWKVMEDEDQ